MKKATAQIAVSIINLIKIVVEKVAEIYVTRDEEKRPAKGRKRPRKRPAKGRKNNKKDGGV